jgi:hypothetical protein
VIEQGGLAQRNPPLFDYEMAGYAFRARLEEAGEVLRRRRRDAAGDADQD